MNANAIYSKSGKGVQEAAGKTSNLSRPDRAVLSAIDGRATLADVAQKVGKTFDPAFVKLIEMLDKGGFVREVSPGTAPAAKPAAKPAAGKPAASAPMDAGSDLDFTAAMSAPKGKAPPPPKHTATIPPAPPPPSAAEKVQAAKSAQEQQDAFAKAREEAEKKAQADRDRVKAETEAKMRVETEAKLRAEAESKGRADAEKKIGADAEAKIKAARDAAVKAATEAKAKADAEARKAREEADRVRKEAEDTTRREREEFNRKLEEERKAREEAERKAKEEAKRLEEERRKLEEERKREEQERAARRKREEEEAEERRRKKREEEEEEERRKAAERAERKKREQEEEERERAEREAKREAERAERKKREEEEEAQERAEREARRKTKQQDEPQEEEEKPKAKPAKEKAPEKEPQAAKGGGGFSDSLLADLESFTNRDEEERKEKEEAERKAKEEAARRAREAEERRAKEDAERQEREEKERRKQEEKDRKAKEEAELREREEKEKDRFKEEEEKRKREADEREKKAKQDERLTVNATRGASASAPAYDSEAERRSRRERELAAKPRAGAVAARAERKGGLGKPIALGLLGLVVVALGVAHVMPIDTADYERAATDALGRQVKISSARLSLFSGLQVKFSGVAVGDDVKIAEVRGYPGIGALTGPKKDFSRLEIDGARIDQRAVGDVLFVKVKADNFSVGRIVAKQIEFPGPLALPKGLEVEVNYDADGAVQSAAVRGPEALLVKLAPKGSSIEVDLSASSFTLPFAPEISLSKFGLKGTATPQGLSVSEWDGAAFNGTLAGTANVVWGETWTVDGVIQARNINAAVFAPALLSEGKGEGSGKFSMRGQPGKLAAAARLDGNFTVSRGVLGTIDLSRAIQTSGKQATGRTQFNEMNGQAVYDRGAVSLRNVTISAGQLNAGASAEIAQSGALSGRIVADVRVASQTLRATLNLGGNLKEPQVRN